jgi:lauroyl/myristoyl acyltransferase
MGTRGNRFGFAFFDFLISLGVGHAYVFLNFVALHYLLFDRKAVARTAAYLARRFPGESVLKRLWRTHRIFVEAGRVLVDLRCLERETPPLKMECDTGRIRRLLSAGKGVVSLTAHVGNWQVMMRNLHGLGDEISVVMRPEDNPAVAEWLGVERAAGKEIKLIDPGKGPETALAIMGALSAGGIVAIMADKPIEEGRTLESALFGVPAFFPEGPFLISALTDAPVVFPIPRRSGKLEYVLDIHALEIPPEARGKRARRDAYLAAYVEKLEVFLKEHPYDWTPAGEI